MRKILSSFIALMFSVALFAAPRTVEEAADIAARFTNSQPQLSRLHKAPRKAADMRLVHKTNMPNSAEPALYIFNQNTDEGFVIVSADDNAIEILGYSDEGSFDASNIPSNMQFFLEYYAERVAAAQPATHKANSVRKAKAAVTPVSPLLGGIKWDQGTPYNDLCPMDKKTRAYTGCVATAAAQIMRYYKWPEKGQGSHTDNWTSDAGKSGTETVDFSKTTYDWANMLEYYSKSNYNTTQANAVATLMYHVGVSCDMQYGGDESNGSGAYTNDMGEALVSYFSYKNTATYKKNQTTNQLKSLFTTELLAGRPVLMGGESSDGGHEFVCDGIDEDGYFHINWGWGGSSNGFFALNALDPDQQGAGGSASGAGFSKNIDCVIGIEPDKNPVHVTGVTISPASATIKIKERFALSATITPDDASNKGMVWSTSDKNIATVSADGVVVGVAAGEATITVSTNDGNKTSTCVITVSNEVMEAYVLEVDAADAEYDDQYEEPWTIDVYKDNANYVPYVRFFPSCKSSNKIAGSYTLGSNSGYLWNDPDDENAYIKITSGQLVVACVGKDDGANGCNTYHVMATFTCSDGVDYKVDATLEICAHTYAESEADQDPIDLADNVGDGVPVEITWMADGDEFTKNIAVDKKVTLPSDKPAACESGKVFVGWCANENYSSDDAPTFIKNGQSVTGNTTFYAVFATAEAGSSVPSEVASVTFSTAANDGNTDISGDIESKIVEASTGISSFDGSKVYAGKEGAKIGSSKASGYITLTLSEKKAITKVIIDASDYGQDVCNLSVSADGTTIGESQNPGSDLEFVASEPVEADNITIDASKRVYIASIRVIAGGGSSYSEYSTSCGAPCVGELTGITLNTTNVKKTFKEGDTFNYAGLVVTANFSNGCKSKTVKPTSVSTPDMNQIGDQTITVTYEGKTATYTITINALDVYTIRFYSNGELVEAAQNVKEGQEAVKPANPSACAGYTFEGWCTEVLGANNTDKPAFVANFKATKDQDYYAVFSKTEQSGLGNEYEKISTLADLTTGNYVVVGNEKYALLNEVYNNYYMSTMTVSTANDVISDPAKSIIWKITRNNNSISFLNEDIDKYVYLYQSGTYYDLGLQDAANWFTPTVSSGNWTFESNDCAGYYLVYFIYNKSVHEFAAKPSSSTTIQLYKQGAGTTTYYLTTINCTATGIENGELNIESRKIILNGQLYILVGDQMYIVTGARVR